MTDSALEAAYQPVQQLSGSYYALSSLPLRSSAASVVKNNKQETIATPAFLSVAQRKISLRPQGRLITLYSLRRSGAGDVGGHIVNGYV
jgi:hypothetical protein